MPRLRFTLPAGTHTWYESPVRDASKKQLRDAAGNAAIRVVRADPGHIADSEDVMRWQDYIDRGLAEMIEAPTKPAKKKE